MSVKDDRKEFEENRVKQSVALGQAASVFKDSLNLVLSLDRFDYSYLWTWLGVPIIQMPADVMATQEVIWSTKPDIIIETGIARGGSVLFLASMLELIGKGQVIGVDIDIRAHNREAIESHPMSKRVTMIQGPSNAPDVVAQVVEKIPAGSSVMVILDSDHSRDHVLSELRAYAPLVTKGCYLVVADTLVGHIEEADAPRKRSKLWFKGDEPLAALYEYLGETDRFEVDPVINGKLVVSSSPGGYLKCIRD
ncbi:MAG: cephalosporin hydroxylase family protein [Parvibaculum sp.]|nr:cephalosporin hydroxylase family protein [Parvibaculum sp.]